MLTHNIVLTLPNISAGGYTSNLSANAGRLDSNIIIKGIALSFECSDTVTNQSLNYNSHCVFRLPSTSINVIPSISSNSIVRISTNATGIYTPLSLVYSVSSTFIISCKVDLGSAAVNTSSVAVYIIINYDFL